MSELDLLKQAAKEINESSDELSNVIKNLDLELKKLNTGLHVWNNMLGYTKVDNHWGLCVREGEQVWLFNDAPRNLRLVAINELQPLLKLMTLKTKEMSARIAAKRKNADDYLRRLING